MTDMMVGFTIFVLAVYGLAATLMLNTALKRLDEVQEQLKEVFDMMDRVYDCLRAKKERGYPW